MMRESKSQRSGKLKPEITVVTSTYCRLYTMTRPATLLVTVGSTLFTALTNKVLSPSILSILPGLGFELFILQYGSGDLLALTEIEDLEVDAQGSGEFTWRDYNGLGEVRVKVMRYTNDFTGLVNSASAVISHAGGTDSLHMQDVLMCRLRIHLDCFEKHAGQTALGRTEYWPYGQSSSRTCCCVGKGGSSDRFDGRVCLGSSVV